MIQARSSNLREVILGDPGIPVPRQALSSFVLAKSLGVCVFVFDVVICGPLGKDGRRDPRFQDKPTA